MSGPQEPSETTPITVEGYSARYVAAARRVLGLEGGSKVTDDRDDPGGTTKFGVSLRFLVAEGAFDDDHDGRADFDLDMDGDIDGHDVRLLTSGDALFLFHKCFWLRLDCESFPRPLGEAMFDQGVNGGIVAARKLLQRALNACVAKVGWSGYITVDGRIGPITHTVLDRVLQYPALGMPSILGAYREAAGDRYRSIAAHRPASRKYLGGWLARAERLGRE